MKNEQLYYKTVNTLAKAYLEGTLEHHNCSACAVGNLVGGKQEWYSSLQSYRHNLYIPQVIDEIGILQIEETGYTIEEIDRIEKVFEREGSFIRNPYGDCDKDGFLGLMAVVDVLDGIHGNTDVSITEKSKNQIASKIVYEVIDGVVQCGLIYISGYGFTITQNTVEIFSEERTE